MIYSIYGFGKFKTEACIGMTVRAVSVGHKVCFRQFLKDEQTSESTWLSSHPLINYATTRSKLKLEPVDKTKCEQMFLTINLDDYDLIVLDEIHNALDLKINGQPFVEWELFEGFINKCKEKNVDVCCTGRIYDKNLRKKMKDIADIVSDNHCKKHCFNTHCVNCSKDYEYYFKYCPECGKRLSVPQQARKGRDY